MRQFARRLSSHSKKKVEYLVAAAHSPKLRGAQQQKGLLPGLYSASHPPDADTFTARQRSEAGEDAFVSARMAARGHLMLGVADGVGSWRSHGVETGLISQALCLQLATAAHTATRTSPLALLQTAFDELVRSAAVEAGSTTACVGTLTPHGRLRVANVGDSGYMVFRHGRLLHASQPQQHYFNAPFQLTIVSPAILAQLESFGGKKISDPPAAADVSEHDLQHGDVLLFQSDGLLDNLYVHDVLRHVNATLTANASWQNDDGGIAPGAALSGGETLARSIVSAAMHASMDATRDGPWTKELQRNVGAHIHRGGKPDDITVLVVLVQDVVSQHVK